jgi:hypothetical protein
MARKPTFQELQTKWYEKLEKSGFKDIEKKHVGEMNWPSDFVRESRMIGWQAKQEYYRMAEHFLTEHKFKNRLERIIWEYHANGISVRNIVVTLQKVKVKGLDRNVVWKIVNKLETIMKKKYLK